MRADAFTRGSASVLPAASAASISGRVSHSLRNASVSSTQRASRNEGRAATRAAIEADAGRCGGGLALVPTAPEVSRNRDSLFPYRADSYFYYLSGFPEPEAVIALVAAPDGDRHILFCREKNAEREIWDGFRYGPDQAREIFGFDEAYPIAELSAKLADWTCDRPALYTPLGLYPAWDDTITKTLNEVRNRVRTGVAAPEAVV